VGSEQADKAENPNRRPDNPQNPPLFGGAAVPEATLPPNDTVLTIESLIREHHAALYRYAWRLTGSAADAEDLVQQAFMTAFRKLDQVREPEHVSSWLYAVLRSQFLKGCRKQQPQVAGAIDLNLDHLPERALPPAKIDSRELQLALDDLPPEYKIVVVMFYFEHASYKQIAAALELPIGTVMSRLARAKERLRAKLADEDDAVRLSNPRAKHSFAEMRSQVKLGNE
jgi:RNA polymerase sigma-70 factor (ECF subfamily)